MATVVDELTSARYRAALEGYLSDSVLDGDRRFVCRSGVDCRMSAESRGFGFAAGQLSHVGSGYACRSEDAPLRILVVSIQVGDPVAPVDMRQRSEQIRECIPLRPGQRNPHMRGVTRALQLLHGLSIDPDDELLPDRTHVLEAYAMANSVLCSALPTDGVSRRGQPTPTMLDRCSEHLRATVSALEPTIVHTQGVDTQHAIEGIATIVERHSDEVSIIRLGDREIVLCATSHPAAGPPKSWSSTSPGSYFAETVAPALRLARQLALSGPDDEEAVAAALPVPLEVVPAESDDVATKRRRLPPLRPGQNVGALVLAAVDQAIETRWEPAQKRAAATAGHDTKVRVKEVRGTFRTELAVAGGAAGGVAAVPGSVAPAVAAGIAEIGWSTVRLTDMILTIAVIHGHEQPSVEERRAWVLAVLAYGDAAAGTFSKLAAEMGKGLGKKATRSIPMSVLRGINSKMGRTIITKYGTKRGAIAVGRLLPFGVGATIGFGLNAGLVTQVSRHADKFFRQLPPPPDAPDQTPDPGAESTTDR